MSSDNIPTTEPTEAVQGSTWEWKREDFTSDYPSDEWTLTYTYLLKTGTTTFTITATDDDGVYLVSVPASTTAGYTAGEYEWQANLTDIATGNIRKTIDRGCFEVLQDFSADTSDPRTPVQKIFDALEATIQGRASRDVMKTEINGKKIERMAWEDILKAYNHFKNLAKGECLDASSTEDPNARAENRIIRHYFGNPS